MFIQSKVIYRFSVIAIKNPNSIFTEMGKKSLNFLRKHKRSQIVKSILRKKGKAGGITLNDLKMCYNATVSKTVCAGIKTAI